MDALALAVLKQGETNIRKADTILLQHTRPDLQETR